MEIENKLDEDFVFYLGFVNSYLKHVRDKDIRFHCEVSRILFRPIPKPLFAAMAAETVRRALLRHREETGAQHLPVSVAALHADGNFRKRVPNAGERSRCC
jgi:hypothetical protein